MDSWWGLAAFYLAVVVGISLGTLIALGLGTGKDYPEMRRSMRRTLWWAWIWPIPAVWLIVLGIRAVWREIGQ